MSFKLSAQESLETLSYCEFSLINSDSIKYKGKHTGTIDIIRDNGEIKIIVFKTSSGFTTFEIDSSKKVYNKENNQHYY